MAVTENLHTGNGSKTNYAFTFPYLKTTDIKVSVDGTVVTNFTAGSPTATEIQFNTAPANNAAIRIYRDTATENLSATFYAGSAIKSEDLNDNFLQNLYVTQEAKRDAASAWQDGDETINSSETWHTSDDTKVATTKAIENRIAAKIDTAIEGDVLAGTDLTKTQTSGQVTINHSVTGASSVDNSNGTVIQDLTINGRGHVTATGSIDLDTRYFTETEADARFQPKDAELTELATMSTDTASALADLTQAEVQILDGATVTKDELNILDGVTATKDEINILDGVTATKDELNILDGVTATAAELNKLDGVTASTTELNKVDGLTASTAELNILDGVTATTAELNKTDGLTATPVELNTLDGVTSNTSELNKLDGYTGSTNDLNIVSGKSFKTSSGTLDTTSDTEIPSSKVIAAHVASSQTAIGGFVTIADEVSFPTTANMPANGVVVSINNAAGVVVNGSGVSTTGRTTDGTPATVTINGFPSSLNGETLAAGVGLMVTATSTSNTYSYHKILAAETDVKQLSDDINDFNARYRIASSAPGSNNDEGDLYFDTAANKMKVYNGSAWDDVASVGNFYINTLSSSSNTGGGSATFNGSAYRFTLSNPPTMAQQLIVSVNGVIQKPNAGTSQPSEGFAINGNDIIFSAAPASGADYFIVTQGSSVSIGTPSDNTVTSAKIVDGSIVNGDISSSANIASSKLAKPIDLADDEKIRFGTGNDLEIYHHGSWGSSYINNSGSGAFFIESDDIRFRKADNSELYFKAVGDGAVELYYDNSKKFETTSTGVTVTGNVNLAADNNSFTVGAGSDLQIYHDGTNNILRNVGTRLDVIVNSSETAAVFNPNGSVDLYYDNNKQLSTNSTGVIVGDSDHTDSNLRVDHEDNTGKGRVEVNAFGTANIQLLSNFSGSTEHGVPTGAFGLTTPQSKDIHICTGGTSRMMVGSSGQLGIAGANYGTSGQVLTSQGASSAPQWADAGGGAWEKLTSGTVSSGNTANITTTHLTSSYQLYRLTFDVRGSGDIEDVLYLQQYSNGAWQTSTYRVNYGQEGSYATNNSMAGLWLGNLSKRWLGTINFSEPYATDTSTFYRYDGFTNNDNGGSTANGSVQEHKAIKVGGGFNDNTATTGLRFLLSSGSNAFTRGWFLLEGCAIS